MKLFGIRIFILFFLVSSLGLSDSLAQGYEKPVVFSARKLLSSEIMSSKLFTIQEAVPNDGYMNAFSISSKYGDYQVKGYFLLEARLQEIKALADMEENFPSSKVLGEAAYNTGKGIVTAPVRAVEKAYDTVTDTKKLKKTAKSVPGGVVSIFSFAASTVESGAQFVYDTGKSVVTSNDGGEKKSTSEQLDKAASFVSDQALDFIGYTKASMEIYKHYSLNPYTDNEVIRSEVRRIASIKSGVGMAGKFAPGIPGLPYVGSFNRYAKLASDISAYDDPAKVEAMNKKILKVIGDKDGLPKDWDSGFVKNPYYTPLSRRLILHYLDKMNGVQGKASFIELAANASDLDGALFYLNSSSRLFTIHTTLAPLSQIVDGTVLPAGLTKEGVLYLPLPVDHILWTENVAKIFKVFEAKAKKEYPVKTLDLHVAGTVSDRCRRELRAMGVDRIAEKLGY